MGRIHAFTDYVEDNLKPIAGGALAGFLFGLLL
jgi:hypothetical protein